MSYRLVIGHRTYLFADLKALLAKAAPARSGDALAGIAAFSDEERLAARLSLAEQPLTRFLEKPLIAYEEDDLTRLIRDRHSATAFRPIAHLSVGEFRNWLLADTTDTALLSSVAAGITPEMASAVSKLMRNQDLILIAQKCRVVTRFRNTIGLPGRLSVRLQPNHPTDDLQGIAASILDGLLYGAGDAVIGINPASDSVQTQISLLQMVDARRLRYEVPTQSCMLTHVTSTIRAIELGAPVDLVFQSIAGAERANASFGVNLALLREARAYAVAREFAPWLVNTVVGFIGPEYLYDGKQIIRAGLEDHFCGKLLGLAMGCDIDYTNHAEADQDDMDILLTLLAVAGVNFIMGVPGADEVMLRYQSTSFHDALYARRVLKLRRAPEFEEWLERIGLTDCAGRLRSPCATQPLLEQIHEVLGSR